MSKRLGILIGATLTAGSLALLPTATAATAPAASADTALLVSVTHDSTGAVSAAGLMCRPPAGHPFAGEACAQLIRADGFIENIPPTGDACALIYDPVTVRANGFWHGEPRAYEATFANRCVAVEQTGGYLFQL